MYALSAAISLEPIPAPQVLLIDDDDFIAISLRHYLTARGCVVDTAATRKEADNLLRERAYDLILTDPYITGEAGSDASEFLQSLRRRQPHSRIVVASAYTSPQLFAAGEASDLVAVLTKPQSLVFLSQLVMSALKARQN